MGNSVAIVDWMAIGAAQSIQLEPSKQDRYTTGDRDGRLNRA